MVTVTKSRISKTRLPDVGREKADRVIKFVGTLKHSTGEYAGKPFILMPWQEDMLRRFYGTLNPDGTRQYRTLWLEVARKNGKTEIGAGGIALPLLYVDGEMGAQIYSAANDKDQASLMFDAAVPMVEQSPTLMSYSQIYKPQKRIVYYRNRSYYRAISAEAYTKDGLNPHGVLYDELHAAPNRELWDVLTTAQGARRQPVTAVTTTAGYDKNSICWELHDYACKVRDGIIEDPTFLPIIYAVPEDADWTDESLWPLANPALGVFRSLDELRTKCRQAKENPALEMTFRRLYLNQWVNSVQRWLPMDKWDECAAAPSDLSGRPCYEGLDLSSTTDLTSLAKVFPRDDGSYDVVWHYWIPEDTAAEKERRDRVPYRLWAKQGFVTLTPGNIIDYGYVKNQIREDLASYDLRELAFDRWGSQKLMTDLEELGFSVDPKAPGPHLVAFGQGFASMSPPTKELMTLTLSQKIHHGGNPVSRWCADNLVVATDPAGNLKPDKAKATQKIDGMVAMIMALDRATRHTEDGSVYEGRGLATI